jgi:hypothetical protein
VLLHISERDFNTPPQCVRLKYIRNAAIGISTVEHLTPALIVHVIHHNDTHQSPVRSTQSAKRSHPKEKPGGVYRVLRSVGALKAVRGLIGDESTTNRTATRVAMREGWTIRGTVGCGLRSGVV